MIIRTDPVIPFNLFELLIRKIDKKAVDHYGCKVTPIL